MWYTAAAVAGEAGSQQHTFIRPQQPAVAVDEGAPQLVAVTSACIASDCCCCLSSHKDCCFLCCWRYCFETPAAWPQDHCLPVEPWATGGNEAASGLLSLFGYSLQLPICTESVPAMERGPCWRRGPRNCPVARPERAKTDGRLEVYYNNNSSNYMRKRGRGANMKRKRRRQPERRPWMD